MSAQARVRVWRAVVRDARAAEDRRHHDAALKALLFEGEALQVGERAVAVRGAVDGRVAPGSRPPAAGWEDGRVGGGALGAAAAETEEASAPADLADGAAGAAADIRALFLAAVAHRAATGCGACRAQERGA